MGWVLVDIYARIGAQVDKPQKGEAGAASRVVRREEVQWEE